MAELVNEEFLRRLYTQEQFEDILEQMKQQIREKFPEWSDHLSSNFGIALLEMWAGIADMFRFYQNVTAVESFPSLARLRESLFRHARWFSYLPKPAGAARADLTFTVKNPALGATVPMGTRVTTADSAVTFETTDSLTIPPGSLSKTVGAVHATYIRDELVGTSTGEANQRFELGREPLVVLSGDENPDELPHVRVWVGGNEWPQARSLAWAAEAGGALGEAFKVEIEPQDTAYIAFGDGLFGSIPPEGEDILASYLVGGGPGGNVGPGTLNRLTGTLANIKSVSNPQGATGGHSRESEEELRHNIPSQVITRGRAVTRADYTRLLEAHGEVAKVNIYHPEENVVEVYVMPQGGGLPSQALKGRLGLYLDNIRMITEDVRILDPTLIPLDITADVWVQAGHVINEVTTQIYYALRDQLGLPEFARTLYPSDVYKIIQRVPGVVKVDVTELARPGQTGVNTITSDPHELLMEGTIKVIGVPYTG